MSVSSRVLRRPLGVSLRWMIFKDVALWLRQIEGVTGVMQPCSLTTLGRRDDGVIEYGTGSGVGIEWYADAEFSNGESWGGQWLADIQRFPGVVTAGRLTRTATPLRVAVKTAPYIGAGLIMWDDYQEDQAIWRTVVESSVEITIDAAVIFVVQAACATVIGCVTALGTGIAVTTWAGPIAGEVLTEWLSGSRR